MNQEEELKNILWSYGQKIEDATKALGISKQTLYNNIRKTPLNKDFKKKWDKYIESLDKKSSNKAGNEKKGVNKEIEALENENRELRKELDELKNQLIQVLLKEKK
jgi:hypothetical protein